MPYFLTKGYWLARETKELFFRTMQTLQQISKPIIAAGKGMIRLKRCPSNR
jgi:hypothetical protein